MKLKPARESVLSRFERYVKIDTQSQEGSETYPSTEKQWAGKILILLYILEVLHLHVTNSG